MSDADRDRARRGSTRRAPRSEERAEEADERQAPRGEGDDDEDAGDNVQQADARRTGEAERADRVHPQREDRSPVERVVGEREALVDMAPEAEDDQHRDPPGGGRPEEDRQ